MTCGKTIAKKAQLITLDNNKSLPPRNQSDDSKSHLDNWIDCIRTRNPMTNGHIHTGFWHAAAVIMATRAYRERKKLYWNRQNEEIVDHK